MKKLIIGLTMSFALYLAFLNLNLSITSKNKLNIFDLRTLIISVQANSESGGQTNCYGGGTPWLGGTSLPKCETNCPYVKWKNPIQTGTCNF